MRHALSLNVARAVPFALTLGFCHVLAPSDGWAQTPDLIVNKLQSLTPVGTRAAAAGDPATYADIPAAVRAAAGNPIIGFTFDIEYTHNGNHPGDPPGPPAPIAWEFPINETTTNPWNAAFAAAEPTSLGFTFNGPGPTDDRDPGMPGLQPGSYGSALGENDHYHLKADANIDHRVGRHPHMLFRLFRCPVVGGPKQLIGISDLKHAARDIDDPHHQFQPGEVDFYSEIHNSENGFYGPFSEMAIPGFFVPAHDHMGSVYPALDAALPPEQQGGHWRDHGEFAFAGGALPGGGAMPADPGHPGVANVDHLLQVKVDVLNQPGFRYFLAGTVYVAEEGIPTLAAYDASDNTRWHEFDPGWNPATMTFTPTMLAAEGLGLASLDAICVPESAVSTMMAISAAALLGKRRCKRMPT